MAPRLILALLWIVLAVSLSTYWLSGDLGAAWIIVGLPAALAIGAAIGLAAVAIAGGGASSGVRLGLVGGAASLALLLAVTSIGVPSRRPLLPPGAQLRAARAFAEHPPRIDSIVSAAAGAEVHVGSAEVRVDTGVAEKQPFSFAVSRRPASVSISAFFDLGPAESVDLRLIGGLRGWRLDVPPTLRASLAREIAVRPAEWRRRFPNAALIEVAGHGRYAPGAVLPVREATSATEFGMTVMRVQSTGDPLRVIERVPRPELLARIERFVGQCGYGGLRGSRINYTRPPETRVQYVGDRGQEFFAFVERPLHYKDVIVSARAVDGRLEFAETIYGREPGRCAPAAKPAVSNR